MSRSRLDPKLFRILKKKTKGKISDQAIRNALSGIRSDIPGITLNAAASIFAQKRGFKVMKYLAEEDRQSLQNISYSLQKSRSILKQPRKSRKTPIIGFGQKFITDACSNADVYPYIYILENMLRNLILNIFTNEPNWWTKKVSKDVQEYAKTVQKAEDKHDWLPGRGNHPIYYIGLYELYRIISKNHPQHFKTVFKDQGNLRTWINECVPIRNLLAHNVRVQSSEKQNLKIRTKYICRIVENWLRKHGAIR